MIKIEKFKIEDLNELTIAMKNAFDYDSQIHLNTIGGPDGYDNGDFIKKWFMHPKATAYTVYDDDIIIGGINLWINQNNINYLGCIFIDPKYENKGIGTTLWQMIEKMYPKTICWRTETPIFSHRNHHFYINKCGFKCVKITDPKSITEGQFQLEKYMH